MKLRRYCTGNSTPRATRYRTSMVEFLCTSRCTHRLQVSIFGITVSSMKLEVSACAPALVNTVGGNTVGKPPLARNGVPLPGALFAASQKAHHAGASGGAQAEPGAHSRGSSGRIGVDGKYWTLDGA